MRSPDLPGFTVAATNMQTRYTVVITSIQAGIITIITSMPVNSYESDRHDHLILYYFPYKWNCTQN